MATLLLLIAMSAPTVVSAPAVAAVTAVPDPDRNSTDLTAWGWSTNVTPAQMEASFKAGYRPIDIEVNSSAPTFSVSWVHNSGTYGRGWWWYYGLTANEVGANLTANNARPTDIEAYDTASGLRFAVLMVSNSGVAGKGWWWFYNQTPASIGSFASANNARVVDLERYSTGAGDRFAVILLPNTGVDGSAWWIYYNLSPSALANNLKSNNARLIDIERTSSGGFDVVMVPAGPDSWWFFDQTPSSLGNAASQLGARITKIEPYLINGTRYFAAVLINNVDAETTRIRDLVSSQMLQSWGFYVKKVGAGDVVGLQPDRVFEPASMIKIVHAVTALREVQAGTGTTLSTSITWYANPDEPARLPSDPNFGASDGTDGDPADKDVCAYDKDGKLLTGATYMDELGSVILAQALGYSDNRTTDALTRRYGFAGLNATMALAGMTKSHIYHRVGCQGMASPQPIHANELTLRDVGRIYEGVENGTLLDATRRNALYGYLVGGIVKGNSPLGAMITAEASAAGLTASETNQFLSLTLSLTKGGGYTVCSGSTCDLDSTAGGILFVPFKTTGQTPYVYGRFSNVTVNCNGDSIKAKTCTAYNTHMAAYNVVAVEMFRKVIKEAMATW